MTVWESTVEFLQDLIRRFGVVKLILGFCAVMGALVGAGFAVSPETQIRLVGISAIVILLLICLALVMDRNRLRNKMGEGTAVLDRYGDEIVSRQTTDSFEIKDWRDEQYIDRNGDTTVCRRITVVVRNQPLQTFWHRLEMTTQRTDLNYRKKLTVETKNFNPQTLKPGVNYLHSPRWEQHALRIFVHLDRVYDPGEEVHVYIEVYWPEFNKHILESKQGDTAQWILRRKVDNLQVSYTFLAGAGIKRDFAIQALPASPSPQQTHGPGGTIKVDFNYPNPPKDTAVGFIIQRTSW